MVVNRISLAYIYDTLLPIDSTEGKIDSILLNVKTEFGSKLIPRFNSIDELKEYMNEIYPYSPGDDCSCLTKNEGIYTLLNFSLVKKDGNIVFVNNLSDRFQTAKPDMINEYQLKTLQDYKLRWKVLENLFRNYVCYPYIEFGYIECNYIEILRNQPYYELIELYKNTKLT